MNHHPHHIPHLASQQYQNHRQQQQQQLIQPNGSYCTNMIRYTNQGQQQQQHQQVPSNSIDFTQGLEIRDVTIGSNCNSLNSYQPQRQMYTSYDQQHQIVNNNSRHRPELIDDQYNQIQYMQQVDNPGLYQPYELSVADNLEDYNDGLSQHQSMQSYNSIPQQPQICATIVNQHHQQPNNHPQRGLRDSYQQNYNNPPSSSSGMMLAGQISGEHENYDNQDYQLSGTSMNIMQPASNIQPMISTNMMSAQSFGQQPQHDQSRSYYSNTTRHSGLISNSVGVINNVQPSTNDLMSQPIICSNRHRISQANTHSQHAINNLQQLNPVMVNNDNSYPNQMYSLNPASVCGESNQADQSPDEANTTPSPIATTDQLAQTRNECHESSQLDQSQAPMTSGQYRNNQQQHDQTDSENRHDIRLAKVATTQHNDYIDMRSYGNISQDWLDTICRHMIEHMNDFGICVIDDFLGVAKGDSILREVLQLYSSRNYSKGRLVNNKLNSQNQRSDGNGTIRSDRVIWIDDSEAGCEEINNLIQTLCSVITNSSRLSLYSNNALDKIVINKRTKAHVACYPGNGTSYIKHVDNPNGDGRVITAIYYLNKNWNTKRDGGLLRMFPVGMDEVANIEPLFDRVLFFWSDRRNPHEVLPAFKDRFAITVWYIGENRN